VILLDAARVTYIRRLPPSRWTIDHPRPGSRAGPYRPLAATPSAARGVRRAIVLSLRRSAGPIAWAGDLTPPPRSALRRPKLLRTRAVGVVRLAKPCSQGTLLPAAARLAQAVFPRFLRQARGPRGHTRSRVHGLRSRRRWQDRLPRADPPRRCRPEIPANATDVFRAVLGTASRRLSRRRDGAAHPRAWRAVDEAGFAYRSDTRRGPIRTGPQAGGRVFRGPRDPPPPLPTLDEDVR